MMMYCDVKLEVSHLIEASKTIMTREKRGRLEGHGETTKHAKMSNNTTTTSLHNFKRNLASENSSAFWRACKLESEMSGSKKSHQNVHTELK